ADERDLLALRGVARVLQATHETETVEVVRVPAAVGLAPERVGAPGDLHHRAAPVGEPGDGRLVRHRDEDPVDVACTPQAVDDPLEVLGFRVHGNQYRVDAEAGEERVHQRGRLDLGDRIAQHDVQPGGTADGT